MSPNPSTLIRLDGRDSLDLLHRISTQHLRDLTAGACRSTLFCDFRGRIQHRVAVARTSDGRVWLARSDAGAAELLAAIDRQVFRDDVRIEDLSGQHEIVPTAAAAGARPGTFVERGGQPGVLHLEGGVDLVIAPAVAVRAVATPPVAMTAAPAPALDEAARIRLGAPRHGHEIRDDFNPFEIGLARDVHLDKGCFTGQEALLRMMTYGGVRRRLALLEGEGAPPAGAEIVRGGDADAGVVTSVAPAGAVWVALAVLKRDAIERPLVTASGAAIGRITPFQDARPLGLPGTLAR